MSTEKCRADGNSLFKAKDYKAALEKYKECLLLNPSKDELSKIHNNMSQCELLMGNFESSIKHADKGKPWIIKFQVLEIIPHDKKALYRRAQAHFEMKRLKHAVDDIRKLYQIDSENNQVRELCRKIESEFSSLKSKSDSLQGKIEAMYKILASTESAHSDISVALQNLIYLINEQPQAAGTLIWSDERFPKIVNLCKALDIELVKLAHNLIGKLIIHDCERGLAILQTLTPTFFINNVHSRNTVVAVECIRFLECVLESLTQMKAYHKAREEYDKQPSNKVCKSSYPKIKIDPKCKLAVESIIEQLTKLINSYRLKAVTRDHVLTLLIRIVPNENGLAMSDYFISLPNCVDRLMDLASAVAETVLLNDTREKKRSKISDYLEEDAGIAVSESNISSGKTIATTSNTRMSLACLMAKVWNDLSSDKTRDAVISSCTDFIMDLFSDLYIESKAESASILGTIFLGPHELGNALLSNEGILRGLLLLSESQTLSYQTIALDTIIHAINKKEKCFGIVKQAVPILQNLYRSTNDNLKIRSLVGLCKLGVAGGSDANVKALGDGSTVNLLKSCRRMIVTNLGLYNNNNDNELQTNRANIERESCSLKKTKEDHLQNLKWALDGLAFLSFDAEIKELIVDDVEFIKMLFSLVNLGKLEFGFPLASLMGNLVNCQEKPELNQELIELAQFAKQHIPEEHEFDLPKAVADRRERLLNLDMAPFVYGLLTKMAVDGVMAQSGLRELISKIYLAIAEVVDKRGLLVSAGAGKALLALANQSANTDKGRIAASHALAKLSITMDPRVTFPGQRSLEVIRPLLSLLNVECTGLQNFEALMALTNFASLDEIHRHRIMAEKGLSLVDQYLFEEHQMLRRAATECYANMAQYHAFVVSCGGSLPMNEEHISIGKDLIVQGQTERVKLITLYCAMFEEDPLLVKAAAGALATMSYDSGIIEKITNVSNWFEILQALVAYDSPCIQHRGSHILYNIVTYGPKSLAEYLVKSSMLDVIMALDKLEDIDPSKETKMSPSTVVTMPGLGMPEIIKLSANDRVKTKSTARDILRKLEELELIMSVENAAKICS